MGWLQSSEKRVLWKGCFWKLLKPQAEQTRTLAKRRLARVAAVLQTPYLRQKGNAVLGRVTPETQACLCTLFKSMVQVQKWKVKYAQNTLENGVSFPNLSPHPRRLQFLHAFLMGQGRSGTVLLTELHPLLCSRELCMAATSYGQLFRSPMSQA